MRALGETIRLVSFITKIIFILLMFILGLYFIGYWTFLVFILGIFACAITDRR